MCSPRPYYASIFTYQLAHTQPLYTLLNKGSQQSRSWSPDWETMTKPHGSLWMGIVYAITGFTESPDSTESEVGRVEVNHTWASCVVPPCWATLNPRAVPDMLKTQQWSLTRMTEGTVHLTPTKGAAYHTRKLVQADPSRPSVYNVLEAKSMKGE